MSGNIPGKQRTGLDSVSLQVSDDLIPGFPCILPDHEHESEPTRIGVWRDLRENEIVFQIAKPGPQIIPVFSPSFYKSGELLKLGCADRRLKIGRFQVVTQMNTHIYGRTLAEEFRIARQNGVRTGYPGRRCRYSPAPSPLTNG